MKHSFAALIVVGVGLSACSLAPEPNFDSEEGDSTLAEITHVSAAALPAPASAAVAGSVAHRAARRPRDYTDARWYFTTDEDIDAWYALTHELEDDFDDICGDTFCEGDYSNYQSLGIRCSVEKSAGSVGVCVWTFAASQDEVVASTGNVRVSTKTWRCKLPVVRDTPVRELLQTLGASEEAALHARLPRSDSSIYDGLIGCL
jgi:hypothetical protein